MTKSLKHRVTSEQKSDAEKMLAALIPYKPETKLVMQPSHNGKKRGLVRVFVEEASGERTDYGYFTAQEIMHVTMHYLLPPKPEPKLKPRPVQLKVR